MLPLTEMKNSESENWDIENFMAFRKEQEHRYNVDSQQCIDINK